MKQTKENMLSNTVVVCLLAMICCILWGSAFPCIKIGYGLWHIEAEETGTQILFAGTRFTLAGILTIIIGSISQKKLLIPNKKALPKISALAIFQTVLQYIFFYIGLANASGVKCSIIEAANVFMAILLASLVFHQEKLNVQKMIGCLFGFAGVILINIKDGGFDPSMHWNGEGFIFISAFAAAVSSALIKKFSSEENPVLLSGYQFILGGIFLMIFGYLQGGRLQHPSLGAVEIVLYLALVSAIAYSLWGILLKYNPVSKVTVFGFMNPVAGVFLSAILLKEQQAFGILAIFSLLLVSIGIYIVNKKQQS